MTGPTGPSRFVTTRWSVVLAAGRDRTPADRAALERLCRACWYPLYAFARRRGAAPEEAEDLVQGFFRDLLERGSIGAVDPARGRFRTFLLTAFTHHASKERERARAEKRGGRARVLSLDLAEGERRYLAEPADERTPERAFDRRFALALLDRVLAALRDLYGGERRPTFEALRPWLVAGADPPPHAETARRLGTSEAAVKVALYRMRARYRALLRGAIAETVASPEEVDDEIRDLLDALAR